MAFRVYEGEPEMLMTCPDCRVRNKCRVDCWVAGCACRRLCESCRTSIKRVTWGAGRPRQLDWVSVE